MSRRRSTLGRIAVRLAGLLDHWTALEELGCECAARGLSRPNTLRRLRRQARRDGVVTDKVTWLAVRRGWDSHHPDGR